MTSTYVPTPSDALIGASAVRDSYDVDGTGLAAAVIDTGVDYDHDAFGHGFGPGFSVAAGYDFGDRDDDPDATTWQHGTHVAGILASQDPDYPGVAPGADVVALRVFGNDNRGDFDRIADALQWVVDHHDEHDITVVNLSISDGNNYAPPFLPYFAAGNRITALVHRLAELDIPVVTATGNSFQGAQGVGFSAIVAETISVSGSDASDHFVADAQRLGSALGGDHATDLLAPSVGVTAPTGGDRYITVGGTSFAAPQVSGAVLLLQQIYHSRFGRLPRVSDLVGWLKAGADPIFDPVTKITIGRLDIAAAAALIPAAPTSRPGTPASTSTPTPIPVPTPTPTPRPSPTPAPSPTPPAPSRTPPAAQSAPASPPPAPPASQSNSPSAAKPESPQPSLPTTPPATPPDTASAPVDVTPPAGPIEPSSSAPAPSILSTTPAAETPATPEPTTANGSDSPASEAGSSDHPEVPADPLSVLFATALDELVRERSVPSEGATLSNGQGSPGSRFSLGRIVSRRSRLRNWTASRARIRLGRLRPRDKVTG